MHPRAGQGCGTGTGDESARPRGQQFQLTINALGRLTDPEQFGDIILKASSVSVQTLGPAGDSTGQVPTGSNGSGGGASQGNTNGSSTATGQVTAIVRLRDVARLELGSQQYDQSCTLDGEPSVALSILAHEANWVRQSVGLAPSGLLPAFWSTPN